MPRESKGPGKVRAGVGRRGQRCRYVTQQNGSNKEMKERRSVEKEE